MLILAVFRIMFLNCIVGEMDHAVHVVEGELFRGCAYVAIIVPICFEVAMDGGDEHVAANVKFPVLVEEWVPDILLDDVGVSGFDVLDDGLYLSQFRTYRDASAPVAHFSWFYNPNILCNLFPQFPFRSLLVGSLNQYQ